MAKSARVRTELAKDSDCVHPTGLSFFGIYHSAPQGQVSLPTAKGEGESPPFAGSELAKTEPFGNSSSRDSLP